MYKILETGIRHVRNVDRYVFKKDSLNLLSDILIQKQNSKNGKVIIFIDEFFDGVIDIQSKLSNLQDVLILYTKTNNEPTTNYINELVTYLRDKVEEENNICAIVGMGGGSTMDIAKAVSNMLTNEGKAEDYVGWDLVKKPGKYKIAIPTLSGTGAEATRTCVLMNKKTGLKLGMNSDYTVFDQIIMDPELTMTVPKNQYFYSGMDSYIHCLETINGFYRNTIGDAFSNQTLSLCREVFMSDEMMSDENRSKLMAASYLGGCAIATSYVGVVHPFSAGLSVVLGIHHCIANCITMRAMEEFYSNEHREFWQLAERQDVEIPEGICLNLSDKQYDQLYASTVMHEKPLTNALGKNFKEVLTKEKVIEIFRKM